MKVPLSIYQQFIVALIYILIPLNSFSQTATGEFKIALVQMAVEPGKLENNLAKAEQMIRQAAANKAHVVLLPEVMDLGWTDPSAEKLAYAIPGGETCRRISKMAKANKVYICCGVVEKDGNRTYNSAVIIDNKGKVLLKHRKLNELDIAHNLYAQGDRLGVCSTPWGTFGLMICADATAKDHVLARSLGYMGADVILSPSSWAVPPNHDNAKDPYGKTWTDAYIPVAREFSMWIASASNVGTVAQGPWKDWKCIGCSMIIDPNGKKTLMGSYGHKAEEILYHTILPTARPARGTGWYNFRPAE